MIDAIDVDQLVKQTYFGRGKVGAQMYPPYVLAADYGKQTLAHDPSALTKIAAGLPADQKSMTIGYDTSNPDKQLISNLVQTQLAAAGLTAKVQGYPTSEIYGWIGTDMQAAPEILANRCGRTLRRPTPGATSRGTRMAGSTTSAARRRA